MKKKLIIAAIVVVALLAVSGYTANVIMMSMTKRHSPFEEVRFSDGAIDVQVAYCRPFKKGREIFGALVPFGEVWRTGANEATRFETNSALLVAGKKLPAGRYALFTIPEPDKWTVIFNSDAEQWGAFDYNPELDVLRVTAAVGQAAEPEEQFTIGIPEQEDGAALLFAWDTTTVSLPIAANTE